MDTGPVVLFVHGSVGSFVQSDTVTTSHERLEQF